MRTALSLFVVVGLAGCPGKAPPDQNVEPDAGAEPDAAEEIQSLLLTGKAMDYFGNIAVADANLASDGLDPPQMSVTATDGGFSMEIAVGSRMFISATKTGYRPTRSEAISVADASIMHDIYMTTTQDVANNVLGATGAAPTAGTGFLVAELRRNNNTPLDNIPLTNIQLLDAANQPVVAAGPFVFNAAGALDNTITTASTFGGKSRIAYANVPPGAYTLVVSYQNNNGGTQTNNTTVSLAADGTTLALSGGMMGGGGNNVTNPTFATDIYPKLQRAALGGLGCANCHTLTGRASFLPYDDPAATVLANLQARPGAINLTTPADSLLLVRPLYEAPPLPQDHPNATFLDINDADYRLFLLWITNGAPP